MIWNKMFDVEKSWQMVCWFWLTLDCLKVVSCLSLPTVIKTETIFYLLSKWQPKRSLNKRSFRKKRLLCRLKGKGLRENWVVDEKLRKVETPQLRNSLFQRHVMCDVTWRKIHLRSVMNNKNWKKKLTTRMGFEPTRAEHIGLAVQRLNHSATSSYERHFEKQVILGVVTSRDYQLFHVSKVDSCSMKTWLKGWRRGFSTEIKTKWLLSRMSALEQREENTE